MDKIRKMREKNGSKNYISIKIMNIVNKLEEKIEIYLTSLDNKCKSNEILMFDNEFFNLINSQNILKIKKCLKNYIFWELNNGEN